MKNCNSNQQWADKKMFFQSRRLQILISIKESYERKLAAISASISKLEEQIQANEINN
tara:strand:- start:211 stop:384 length:174 start_codon:yes stop_codon:yes gene_type:complete